MSTSAFSMPARMLWAAGALLLTACDACAQQSPQSSSANASAANTAASACTLTRPRAGTRVLVFSLTKGFRHASIPDGVAGVKALGARHGFEVEATEDPAVFTDASLARFAGVVFMMTTGDVLDSAQQAAFQRFIRGGRGYVGVHSASDTEYDWPWYGQLVGAYFRSHPRVQEARLDVRDRTHLSTKCLPAAWTRTDEWYDFKAPPPADAKVLVTIDEKSYTGGRMGEFHPMVWYREFDGGRTIYSEMGHTHESWKEQAYLDHLAGAILWATGLN
jgi:type 1 glutamine amidotransferase